MVTDCADVNVPDAGLTVGDATGVAARPVPLSGIAGSLVPPLSVRTRLAVLPPVVVGANLTPISQPSPGSTSVVHALVVPASVKCAALRPPSVRAEIVAGTGPSLLTMNTFSADVLLIGWLPNARLGGVVGSRLAAATLITGLLEPLSWTTRGEPVLSAIVNVAAE